MQGRRCLYSQLLIVLIMLLSVLSHRALAEPKQSLALLSKTSQGW